MVSTDTKLSFATLPEKAVYKALQSLREPFEFQSPLLGGYREKGSTIADFLLRQYSLIISVIGFYWHNQPGTKARDKMQRIALSSQGLHVIYIDEQAALANATYYCKEAIRGFDHSRYKELV